MLDPEMVEDTAKIVNEAQKDKVQVNLIINNRAGGKAPLIAKKITERPIRRSNKDCFDPVSVAISSQFIGLLTFLKFQYIFPISSGGRSASKVPTVACCQHA
jgi:hypothetical protein